MVEKRAKIIRTLVLSGILLFVGFLLSQTVGLGAGGFDTESVLKQFNFYSVGIGFLMIVVIFFFVMYFWRKGDEYGDSIMFGIPGESPGLSIFKNFSNFQMFLLFLIIFSILGLFAVFTNQQRFTEFVALEHQFTPVGELAFSSLLIPISENLGAAAVLAVFIFLLVLFGVKYNLSKGNYNAIVWIAVPILFGFYGYINHLLRYGGSDTSKMVVFIFWAVGGLLTVITTSFIPFLMMHFDNNFFFDLKRLFGSEIQFLLFAFGIVILIVFYLWMYVFKKKEDPNKIYGGG